MDAELVAQAAPGVDPERVLARRKRGGEARLHVLEVGEGDLRLRLDAVHIDERDVLVLLRRVRREVRARDGERVRARDHVIDEGRLVEDGVDDGLRAFGVVRGNDADEDRLERLHLDRVDHEDVAPLDPRAREAGERAAHVVADGRHPVDVRDVALALVFADEFGGGHEHGADGGGLVAGALRAVVVGLAAGHRALMLHEAHVEGGVGEIALSLHRHELHCHFFVPFFCVVGWPRLSRPKW